MLCLQIFIVCLFSGLVLGYTETTSASGTKCGTQPACLFERSVCNATTEECECQHPYVLAELSGRLDCFRKSEVWGRGVNDPQYKTLDVEPKTYKYLLPCRVLFTHAKTEMKVKDGRNRTVVGECECKVFSWNEKNEDKGKIFVGGVDVTCQLNHFTDTSFPTAFTTRLTGTSDSGIYNFTEYGSYMYEDPNPPPGRVSIDQSGVKIESNYDDDNNIAYMNVWHCGLRVAFTPYDESKTKDQVFLPGFTAGWHCGFNPMWRSHRKVMATGPVTFGGPPMYKPPGVSRQMHFQHRALTSGIPQTQPNPNPHCNADPSIHAGCTATQLNEVKEKCQFLFEYPKFIKCVDNTRNGAVVLRLFNICVDMVCGTTPCDDLRDELWAAVGGCAPDDLPTEYHDRTNTTLCPV